MKLNKLIAALSAVTMIGSLALPFNAAIAEDNNANYIAGTSLVYESSDEYISINADNSVKMVGTGAPTTAVFSLGSIAAYDKTLTVTVNLNLSNRDMTALGLYVSDIDKDEITYDTCLQGTAIATIGHLKPNTGTVQGFARSNYFTCNSTTEKEVTNATASNLDISDVTGNLYLVAAVSQQASRTAEISSIDVSTTVEYSDTESVYISTEQSTKLYQGESVTFMTTVEPADAVPATISFSAPKLDNEGKPITENGEIVMEDVTRRFVDNGDGSYTYNYNGRCGDSTGAVTVTATSGEKAATTTIYTQRLRSMSYNITNATGEDSVSGFTVKATVDGDTKYDENVTMGSRPHTANNYSGNSVYKMEFTVPEGYKLVLNTTIDGIIIDGNTAYTNGDTDINSDFYVTGTLTKESSTHTSDYFKFDYTADTQRTFRTVTLNATRGTETKEASAALAPEITLEEGAGGIFYMNVTNVPDDVTINSITLN